MTPEEVDLLERGAKAYQYEYKPGLGPDGGTGQQHLGPMAQNLASTEIGQGMVQQDPQTGMLAIDGGRAGVTSLGLLSDVHERLKSLEGQRDQQVQQQLTPEMSQAFGLTGGEVSPEAYSVLSLKNERQGDERTQRALAIPIDVDSVLAQGGSPWRAWLEQAGQLPEE